LAWELKAQGERLKGGGVWGVTCGEYVAVAGITQKPYSKNFGLIESGPGQ